MTSCETTASPMKKRKIISEQSREIAFSVYKYFKKNIKGNTLDMVSEATGIARRTLARIVSEGQQIECGQKKTFSSQESILRLCPKSTVDNFGEEALRRLIHSFHFTDKQRPTLRAVYEKVVDNDAIGFTGKLSSFRKLIKKMGFRWQKSIDNRKILIERSEIREKRCSYIRNLIKYRLEGRPIIFTDETYIHASHTTPYAWVDNTNEGLRCPISKGKRLIIVHAGGDQGFVKNSLLIFKSGQKNGDFHNDMNFENYKRWVETQLIPNLPAKSVIVTDNASYHNVLLVKHPHYNSRKCEMQTWLTERNIAFSDSSTKPELYEIIKRHKPTYKQYVIDMIFASHGHSVLRLPPYHPELNPIEQIWGIVKNRVAIKNVTFKLDDVKIIAESIFADIKREEWLSVCKHVMKVEEDYIKKEHVLDTYLDNFIINVDDDDDDENDYTDSSSDEI